MRQVILIGGSMGMGFVRLFELLGLSFDFLTQGLRDRFTGWGRGRGRGRGRKVVSRTRNVRKVQGKKVRVDEDGVPYGVPGAKFARQAFEGRCTMKSGANPIGMLHGKRKNG